ncbi:mitochondrial intermembrane space import and assembly protein 40 [Lipomyces oligophaga]|uniref:mitochondrial intermembrane space import and assembly protein 40 n=1 Tax=Lipomyces oligophaga TaxID=45792 RepID=UPI0034CE82A2
MIRQVFRSAVGVSRLATPSLRTAANVNTSRAGVMKMAGIAGGLGFGLGASVIGVPVLLAQGEDLKFVDPLPLVEGREQQALDEAAITAGYDDEDTGGAFNPKTGEINWDCPCLGGMAYGPCGEEFKAAFSCFVFSEAEPKGVNCIPAFEVMQNCFRKHPETYADDLRYIDNQNEEAEAEIASGIPESEEEISGDAKVAA